ncbi:hypothetical protein [Crateriforma conspicua]|uniref:Uncharacterized protein n=1 Tax=Crateriforma conspicua TaxID=2527996 RepID=A0A5C5Y3Y6_9PLAN|nr:hypothetical protein [Crateriforma conspicua]TWT69443.1 hypothetical protein Pan14r_17290 [Crateriforma conspicua]
MEDDDAHFAEKMEGPAGELATQFHESEKLQAAQEKSQTPVFSAFGFSSLGVSCPGIAAEGDEQPRETRGKRGPEGKGEAKPEAVFVNGVADVPALADWLADHLDDTELSELLTALTETGMHRG